MQTLKTAAIVVLLMTVMYGAYVSLTTPPEPLPPDVEDMLVIDDGSFAMDASLPASLGQLEINAGTVVAGDQPLSDDPLGDNPPVGQVAASIPGSAAAAGSSEFEDESAGQSAAASSDLAFATPDKPISGYQTTLSDIAATASPATAAIAAASMAGPNVANNSATKNSVATTSGQPSPADAAVDGRRVYPATDNTFVMPDPNKAAAGFDSANESNLALTGGSAGSATEKVSQVAALETPGRVELATDESDAVSVGQRNLGLVNALRTADRLYAEDQHREALATLSIFYNTPNLSGEERTELLSRLDPLARDVIYSKRHLLEQPHRVGQNETLIEIAENYAVPWQLLANINQIKDPVTVLPGTELKVVRGPFRAEVDVNLKELTLFLGDLYAGRFPIGIGNDPAPKAGTFTVQDKQTQRTFYDAAGSPVPPGSPNNPYGAVWLDLGGQLCIHGSPSTTDPTEKGCISLAADYADDLYGILSQGSSVTIRR